MFYQNRKQILRALSEPETDPLYSFRTGNRSLVFYQNRKQISRVLSELETDPSCSIRIGNRSFVFYQNRSLVFKQNRKQIPRVQTKPETDPSCLNKTGNRSLVFEQIPHQRPPSELLRHTHKFWTFFVIFFFEQMYSEKNVKLKFITRTSVKTLKFLLEAFCYFSFKIFSY